MKGIKFKNAEEKTLQLFDNIKQIKSEIKNDDVKFLFEELENNLSNLRKKIKLEIAFVGQYNAGKSSIVSAISGNRNIPIGQDITTDVPKAYPWGNILLIDTPGIYAGRPDHDEASIEYMNKADLLVYVITTQGFTDETGKNFRQLAFAENRVDKIMLVINKSSQGNKELSEENWISDALLITEPKTADDLFLSLIDAEDYIEAFKLEDDSDREALIEYSNFNQFLSNLNLFISQKEFLGRLITPLNIVQDFLNRIINQLTAGNDDTKNMLELLNRKYFRLRKSEKNITDVVNGHIGSLVSKIKEEGNRIATLIEKDGDNEILKTETENSVEKLKAFTDDTSRKVENSIESELSQLQLELDVLMQSEVAQTLLNKDSINVNFNTDINLKSIDQEKVKSGIDVLNNFSNFAKGFALNNKAAEAGARGLRTVSGSEAHKVIYNVGKYFGHNFKPYEAVKYADKLGKLGSIVGKVAVFLPFLVAGYEEYQEKKYAEKIKKERQKVRQSYDEIASNIQTSFQKQYDKFLQESYIIEIEDTKKIINGIRNSDQLKEKEVVKIQELLDESYNILKLIN